MKVFLNAGHGGKDPGAVSKSGIQEKNVCNKICSILAALLFDNGYNVELFQEQYSVVDVSTKEKTSNSDLFVSVHCNSVLDPKANGIETLYYPASTKGKELAESIQNALVSKTKLYNRGLKARTDLHVLKSTVAPAVLVECAFLSNQNEEKLLVNNPELFAQGIFEGIKKYIK